MEAIKGNYGAEHRRDGQKGSIFWFEIPYRPDEVFSMNWKQTLESEQKYDQRDPNTFMTIDNLEHLLKCTISIKAALQNSSISKIAVDISTKVAVAPLDSTPSKLEPILSRKVLQTIKSIKKLNSWKILIAEDSPTIAKMISMMLRQQHHEVTLAENGEIALQKMMKQYEEYGKGYDMVLMDLQMPVLDGLEATRRYRRWEKQRKEKEKMNADGQNIKSEKSLAYISPEQDQVIVGMSANSDEDTIDEAYRAGVNDFISKPFQMDSFNIITKKLLIDHQNVSYHE